MSLRYLFAGLGNPGTSYRGTRHNAGAALVEELARRHGIVLGQNKYRSLIGRGAIAGRDCLLALPQTYMNLSGQAVGRMLTYTGAEVADLVVAHDDLDLPLGRIRLRAGGGSGGHRGVRSIIDHVGSGEFVRLKIGIGRPPAGWATEDYVLAAFRGADRKLFRETLLRAAESAETLVKEGLEKTMSLYNSPA